MTLSYSETKLLIEIVLQSERIEVRTKLHHILIKMGRSEPEFYTGIIAHGPGMHLSSDQWFELLSRLPTRMLRAELKVDHFLSEEQQRKLPPTVG